MVDDSSKVQLMKSYAINCEDQDDLLSAFLDIIEDDPILRASSKKLNVHLDTFPVALIPNDLFTENEIAKLYKSNQLKKRTETLDFESLDSIDYKNVYAVPTRLINALKSNQKVSSVKHAYTSLLDVSVKENKHSIENRCFVCYNNDKLELLYFKRNELTYQSRFEVKSDDEVFYYLMNVVDSFKLDPIRTVFIFHGSFSNDDELYLRCGDYLKNCFLGSRPDQYQYIEELDIIEHHRFHHLYNLK